jgi:hypothetical protein
LLDEKIRRAATQSAWDEWSAQEKQRITVEKEAEKQAKADERKKLASRARQKRYGRNAKAKKEQENSKVAIVTLSKEETGKPLPLVAQSAANGHVDLAMVLAELTAVISALPRPDRTEAIRRVVAVLHELTDDIENQMGEASTWVIAGIDLRH